MLPRPQPLSVVRRAAIRNFLKPGPRTPFNLGAQNRKRIPLSEMRKKKREFIAERMEKMAPLFSKIEKGEKLSRSEAGSIRVSTNEKEHIRLILSQTLPSERAFMRDTLTLILASTRNSAGRISLFQKILPSKSIHAAIHHGRKPTRLKKSKDYPAPAFDDTSDAPRHGVGFNRFMLSPYHALFPRANHSSEFERMTRAAELVRTSNEVIKSSREYANLVRLFGKSSEIGRVFFPIAKVGLSVKPIYRKWASFQLVKLLASSPTWEDAVDRIARLAAENPARFSRSRFHRK